MKKAENMDVVIVGAGPVGLFAALALARRGAAVAIIDSQSHRSAHSYALTLHSQTLRLLEAYGLLGAVLDGARKVSRIDISVEGRRVAGIDVGSIGLPYPYLAVVGQNHLEQVLEGALEEAGVRVRWKHRATEMVRKTDSVLIDVDELEDRVVAYAVAHGEGFVRRSRAFDASFVIGADGFNSVVRRREAIPFPEVGSPEDFAVFQFESVCGDCDAVQIVEKDGLVNVRWPIEGSGCRWSFQLSQDGTPPEYLRKKDPNLVPRVAYTETGVLDENRLRKLLAERVPWCPAKVENQYWNVWVRFERRRAERFGTGRAWLAGDAGHLTSPVGVQSMNVGIAEAHDLANRMADVLNAGEKPGILDEYNSERLAEWAFLLGMSGGLEPMSHADPALVGIRDRLLPWLPASGDDLDAFAGALGFKVSGWSARSRREFAGSRNGE